ncbi:hypothetical protein EON82_23625 [bacterium]|nr:MAG: hypothetical protein EON82_23625 [bacterium]
MPNPELAVAARKSPNSLPFDLPDRSAEYAAIVARVQEALGDVQDRQFVGVAVLLHGRCFLETAELPKGMNKGTPTLCHDNARRVALRRPEEYAYAEGFARPRALGSDSPRLCHSWLVDTEGRVVDRTWDDGEEYDGVVVPYESLREVAEFARRKRASLGFVTDWEGRRLLERMGTTVEELLRRA